MGEVFADGLLFVGQLSAEVAVCRTVACRAPGGWDCCLLEFPFAGPFRWSGLLFAEVPGCRSCRRRKREGEEIGFSTADAVRSPIGRRSVDNRMKIC